MVEGGGGDDRANGGDGDDNVMGGAGTDVVAGGAGDDAVDGSAVPVGFDGGDTVTGGAGNDTLEGGDGNDTLAGGPGVDDMSGELGRDTVDYASAGSDVVVTLDDRADDGQRRERDNVHRDVENVSGGGVQDTFTGSGNANTLDGGTGQDYVDGARGRDRLLGGASVDVVRARDGKRDVIDCGQSTDFAIVDRMDRVRHCERSDPGGGSPTVGQDVVVAPASKGVQFGPPEATRTVPLLDRVQVPVASFLDTRRGAARLTAAGDRRSRWRALLRGRPLQRHPTPAARRDHRPQPEGRQLPPVPCRARPRPGDVVPNEPAKDPPSSPARAWTVQDQGPRQLEHHPRHDRDDHRPLRRHADEGAPRRRRRSRLPPATHDHRPGRARATWPGSRRRRRRSPDMRGCSVAADGIRTHDDLHDAAGAVVSNFVLK